MKILPGLPNVHKSTKVSRGLEDTSDIMVTPKLGVASILRFKCITYTKIAVLGAGRPQSFDSGRPAPSTAVSV